MSKINLFIKNVEIIDSEKNTRGSVLLKEGYINRIFYGSCLPPAFEAELEKDSYRFIDGKGLTLMPSFIDLHTHLRDPGYTGKEDLETGQKAALKGGYTTLCTMANTLPVCDNKETMEYIQTKANRLELCEIKQVSALSKGLEGQELSNLEEMLQYTELFSDDGKTILDEKLMARALRSSKTMGFMIMTHCQPELKIVQRDLDLLRVSGGRLHICHISKSETLELIKKFKDKGSGFSCEVTPHHIFASGLDYRVNPPFRSDRDLESLIKGLKTGYIDAVATDHAPHMDEDKEKGAPGISSLEIAFSLVNTVFHSSGLGLQLLSRVMSFNPARLLGLDAGLIAEGYSGDLVLVDPEEEYQIKPAAFISRGKNNPFAGEMVRGRVKMTVRAGRILYRDLCESSRRQESALKIRSEA